VLWDTGHGVSAVITANKGKTKRKQNKTELLGDT
jgi:hypothetical protein